MQKYFIAARHGQGAVCQQISVILDAYKDEQRRRHAAANQKLVNQNRDLDDYINVDR